MNAAAVKPEYTNNSLIDINLEDGNCSILLI
jgi:hypothetical protein